MEYKEKSPAPLDNDHDDEITQLLVRIQQLEERVRELEMKNNVHI